MVRMGKFAVLVTLLGLMSFGKSAAASEPYMDAQGNFMVRILGTAVLPDSSAATSVAGGNAEVSDAYIPATTLTYFLTPNIAAELFCCDEGGASYVVFSRPSASSPLCGPCQEERWRYRGVPAPTGAKLIGPPGGRCHAGNRADLRGSPGRRVRDD